MCHFSVRLRFRCGGDFQLLRSTHTNQHLPSRRRPSTVRCLSALLQDPLASCWFCLQEAEKHWVEILVMVAVSCRVQSVLCAACAVPFQLPWVTHSLKRRRQERRQVPSEAPRLGEAAVVLRTDTEPIRWAPRSCAVVPGSGSVSHSALSEPIKNFGAWHSQNVNVFAGRQFAVHIVGGGRR